MSNLNIEVAIKTSKGSSQDVEMGRVYQALYPWIEISHGIITRILKLHSLNILDNDIKENNIHQEMLSQITSVLTRKVLQ